MKYPVTGIRKPIRTRLEQLEAASDANIPILVSDIRTLCERIGADLYDETSARAVVRAHFSLIEAIIFYMKELTAIVMDFEGHGETLSKKEKEQLLGKRFEIRRGKLKEVPLPRQSFLERVKFTLKIYLKAWGVEYSINYKDEGWQKLVLALQIRDRLTHPAKSGDVALSRKDFETVSYGGRWFIERQKEIDHLKHTKSPFYLRRFPVT